MLGALIGDIVGSVYEFDNIKTKDFSLLSKNSRFTDDSVMTLAVAEVLQHGKTDDPDEIVRIFQKWGRAYPNAGYGASFVRWVFSENPQPYHSCGNGAAMRISPVGWYADDESQVRDYVRAVTSVTHDHPEGLKGAEVTAMCVYYARRGRSKEFIRQYASQYYDLSFDYEELCQNTVPQAIFCFLISNSFEDCLRTTISIGGDCDTTAAISCAIAEAYYKRIDRDLTLSALALLPAAKDGCDAREILSRFADRKRFVLAPPVPLDARALEKIDRTQIVAVQTAHTGAMGRPGETHVYCAGGGELSEYRFTPTCGDDSSAFSEQARRLAVKSHGFCEIYIGMGNFLYLRSDLKPAFDAAASDLSLSERYVRHKGILWPILADRLG